MDKKVRKWGNSLAVRIPTAYAKETHLEPGATVNMTVADGRIVIDPRARPAYTLDDLLKGVTRRNLHGQVDTGSATGKEAW